MLSPILHVVGARPNFMKAAPVIRAIEGRGVPQRLVHTGQHYDERMSDVFFRQLDMPRPDVNLEVGSGSHAVQTAEIMVRFEPVLEKERPSCVMVYGDVNSTVACALVAAKLGVRVAHVEAGLRSFDRSMPEEINRVLTDQISDLFFTPSEDGDANLVREGIAAGKIHRVGNCMIDTLVRLLDKAKDPGIPGLDGAYALVTLHRPSNVDEPQRLKEIVAALDDLGRRIQVVFPIHPRTRQRMADSGLSVADPGRVLLVEPQGYIEFLWLQQHARFILTDSGGIQEEATYLGVPCLTMRENTERPITCTVGTNILVGQDMNRVRVEADRILDGDGKTGQVPPLWDGKAGDRIAEVMVGKVKSEE